MDEKLTYSVPEMAKVFGLSLPIAYELAHRQDFPAVRVGRRIIIPRAELEHWLSIQASGGVKDGI